ncbi:MAG: hypothetical protein WC102_08260 [Saccharofermentanales bacterium]|jgi:hypothetical protein
MAKATIEEMRAEIDGALKNKGDDWVIAALIDGSIGYHTYNDAKRLIQSYKDGETEDWCERCMACYGCSLIHMMYSDVHRMFINEEHCPNLIAPLLNRVKSMSILNDSDSMMVSLAYPTL